MKKPVDPKQQQRLLIEKGLVEYVRYAQNISGVSSEEFSEYIDDLVSSAAYIDRFFWSRQYGPAADLRVVLHARLAIIIAAEMVYQLNETNYQQWSSGVESKLHHWQRMAWRLGLIFSLGYITAYRTIRSISGGKTWNPCAQSFAEFSPSADVIVERSNRPLCGHSISHRMFEQIFPSSDDAPGMREQTGLALADAFSNTPNIDNPLARVLKRALRKQLLSRRGLALPYWWVHGINRIFSNELGFIPLIAGSDENLDAIIQAPAAEEAPQLKQEPPAVVPVEISAAPSIESAIARLTTPEQSAVTHDTHEVYDTIFNKCVQVAGNSLTSINNSRGVLHMLQNRLIMVYPQAIDFVAGKLSLNVDPELCAQYWRDNKYISAIENEHIIRIVIHPPEAKKSKGVMRAVMFSSQSMEKIKQFGTLPGDNLDLQLMPKEQKVDQQLNV